MPSLPQPEPLVTRGFHSWVCLFVELQVPRSCGVEGTPKGRPTIFEGSLEK